MTAKEYEHHDAAAPEPVAYFDPQKCEFYWARPTQIDAPTTVDVPPLPLYAAPPDDVEALRRDAERLKAENERLRQINWSHEMKLSVRGYEMQIDSLRAERDEAVKAEREACAKAVESRKTGANELMDAVRDMEAAAIRARGEVPR